MSDEKKYKVLVAEDSEPDREFLQYYIDQRTELGPVISVDNGSDAIAEVRNGVYDLLFLDINMPEFSGLEVVEHLDKKKMPYIIFITGQPEYALKAFEVGAVDYLLKPFTFDRFTTAVERFLNTITGDNLRGSLAHGLSFKENRKRFTIDYDHIIYISSYGKHSIIHCIDRDYETVQLLKEVLEKIPPARFVRIHKRHVVNIGFLYGMQYDKSGYYTVFLNDEDETNLPVGRTFVESVKDIFNNR